jgi:hypothetical protein
VFIETTHLRTQKRTFWFLGKRKENRINHHHLCLLLFVFLFFVRVSRKGIYSFILLVCSECLVGLAVERGCDWHSCYRTRTSSSLSTETEQHRRCCRSPLWRAMASGLDRRDHWGWKTTAARPYYTIRMRDGRKQQQQHHNNNINIKFNKFDRQRSHGVDELYINDLSGGQQQRRVIGTKSNKKVALAFFLVSHPTGASRRLFDEIIPALDRSTKSVPPSLSR